MSFRVKMLPAALAGALLLLGAGTASADRKDGEKQRSERWENRDPDYRYGRDGRDDWRYRTESEREWSKDRKEREKDRREARREREKDRREAAREWEKDRREADREWAKDRREAAREARKNRRDRYYR